MSLSNKTPKELIELLSKDYPSFTFKEGPREHWSPQKATITFNSAHACYGVLHELAHALLKHQNYHTDFELLKLESEAWDLAIEIGEKYNITINQDYIQNCLDTYRDWLHRRSMCPSCGAHVLQQNQNSYYCYNCTSSWQVSNGRFVRPYRKTLNTKTTP